MKQYFRNLTRIASRAAAVLCALAATSAAAAPVFPGEKWERVDPAAAGWSMSGLKAAHDYAHEIGSTSVLVVQHGRVVAAWGRTGQKVSIHSVRKSFMSALYGIAVSRHQIGLSATLAQLGIDDRPPRLSMTEKQATVRNLLMARSGIYHKAAYETASMKAKRPARGSHAPGQFWFYNNWDFNALGTILRRATHEDTFAAVERYLARPLQMETFRASDGRYVQDEASEHPAYTMEFTARDLARFGWLYLNQGRWRDRQIVPAAWVTESTRPYSPARKGVNYGYLWWVSPNDMHFRTDVGPGSFSARGAGGQFIVVAPAKDIVVVHLNDMRANGRMKSSLFAELLQAIFAAAPR